MMFEPVGVDGRLTEKNVQYLQNTTRDFLVELNISMINIRTLRRNTLTGAVSVRLDPVAKSYDYCKAFITEFTDSKDVGNRCMIPLIHSLRWKYARYISDLGIPYQGFFQDGELYSLLYAYEPSPSFLPLIHETQPHLDPKAPSRNACILGIPHANTLLPLLTSTIINNIYVIYDAQHFTLNEDGFIFSHYVFSDDFILLANFYGKTIDYIQDPVSIFHQCHLIQIEPNILVDKDHLKQMIETQLIDPIFAQKSFVRIIWIDYFRNTPINEDKTRFERHSFQSNFSDLFPWHLSSTWTLFSKFSLVADSNGFLQKGYQFNKDSLDYLVKVSISLFSLPLRKEKRKPLEQRSKTAFDPKNDLIIVITTVNRVLIDNLLGLQTAIKSLGYKKVQVLYDLTISAYEYLLTKVNYDEKKILHIFVGPSDIALFHTQYIAFNTEQKWQNMVFGHTLPRFHNILSNALAIWNFYQPLTEFFIQSYNFTTNTFTIPLYTYERNLTFYQEILPVIRAAIRSPGDFDVISSLALPTSTESSSLLESNSPVEYTPEILFFGSNSGRRMEYLHFISDEFQKHREKIASPTAPHPFIFRIFTGSWDRLVFDYERDFYVIYAAVILNINNNNDSVLEAHRLNYLLSLGKCVISERGSDHFLSLYYENAVVFVDSREEMVAKAVELVKNEQLRKDWERKALERFQLLNKNRIALSDALKQSFS
jgi:hypothetical protein